LLPAGLEALAVGEEGRGVVDTGRAGGIGRGGGRGGGGLGGDRVRGRRLAGVVQRVARVAVRVAHVALRLTFGGGRGGVGLRGHRVTGDRVVGPGLVALEARVVGARRRRDVAGAQALVGSLHSAHLPYVLVPLGGARVVPDALGAGVVGAVGALGALRAGLVVLAEQLDEQLAEVHHRLAQVLGARVTRGRAARDAVRGAVVLDDLRVVDRDVGRALVELVG